MCQNCLFKTEKYSLVSIYHFLSLCLSTHLSMDACLLPFVNNGALNMSVQVSVEVSAYYCILDIYNKWDRCITYKFCLIFWGTTILFSAVASLFYIPLECIGFHFSCRCHHMFFFTVLIIVSWRSEVVSHYGCDLRFSSDHWCWASFHMLIRMSMSFDHALWFSDS